MARHILYHENSREKPNLQEDAYACGNNIYAVADGITHIPDDNGVYPVPSDSAKVAQIICDEVVESLKYKKSSLVSMKNAFLEANKKVQAFNETRPLYKNRENNDYNIGAGTAAAIWFNDNKLLYCVLDDCFISVFSEDYVDHPMLRSYISEAIKYFGSKPADWSNEDKVTWKRDLRNHTLTKNNKEYGYGAIDGREGFEKYLQMGEVDLKAGDLVCVYTDGFIKMLANIELIKILREQPFSSQTLKYIGEFAIKLVANKEKTGYFIKY